MACGKRDSSGRLISVRFVLSCFVIELLIIFLCCGGIGPVLAAGPDVPGGVGALPVKAALEPGLLGGSVPSQSVPLVLDRKVVSPAGVSPGIVSRPIMGQLSVPEISLPDRGSVIHGIMSPDMTLEKKRMFRLQA
jgi:hypothetical protein